ncbi:uncharacterized protein LOC128550954 [Mercenaria mercenaria]|uniref:uncharacterized protein LOC128550954 n=1 Tax=Mercenaria mercenaria TaxID=6596 RepID=UPI00234E5A70|nr:uncharacterized protein LOC128550954 [Mercenaria mercenaria]
MSLVRRYMVMNPLMTVGNFRVIPYSPYAISAFSGCFRQRSENAEKSIRRIRDGVLFVHTIEKEKTFTRHRRKSTNMFWKLLFISVLGMSSAVKQRRFIYNTQQNPFPNSPFGGGGSAGMISPLGGSGGMTGAGSGTGYTPCIPSQQTCTLQCVNGYVKGPAGCDFCLCSNRALPSVTTIGPVLIDPVDAKGTTTMSQVPYVTSQGPSAKSQTTSVDCMAAKQACASSCGDKGYLVDPSDCTFCLCKSSVMI